jgi:hypothetical protein
LLYVTSACGSSSSNGPQGAAGAGSGATGGGGNGTGAGPDLGNVDGGDGNDGDVGGAGSDPDTCAADLVEAERIPLDMYVMLDVSGSMLEPTEGDAAVTKWQAVSSALTDFVSDDASAGIGVGLQLFPILQEQAPAACMNDQGCGDFGPCINRACWPLIDGEVVGCFDANGCEATQTCVVLGQCTLNADYVCNRNATAVCGQGFGDCVVPESVCLGRTDCRAATYAAPAADIAELPGARDGLVSVIGGTTPDEAGLTPTGPALQGAIQQAKAWATAHPERQVVAVLATDGLPTLQTDGATCGPVLYIEDVQAVIDLAGTGRTTAPAISTFVIGVVGPDDTAAPTILDAIARAGGSSEAFIVDTTGNVQQEFRAALDSIRESGLSCDLAVPTEQAGKPVDYDEVNVEFTNEGGSKRELYRVGDASACATAPSGRGWYYDADPSVAKPTRITVCPAVCKEFQATDKGAVNIALGCETRVVVK